MGSVLHSGLGRGGYDHRGRGIVHVRAPIAKVAYSYLFLIHPFYVYNFLICIKWSVTLNFLKFIFCVEIFFQ